MDNDKEIFLIKDLEREINTCLEKHKNAVEHAKHINASKEEVFKVLYDKVFEHLKDFDVQFAMSEIDHHVKTQIDLFLDNFALHKEVQQNKDTIVEPVSKKAKKSIRKKLFGGRKRIIAWAVLALLILGTLLNLGDEEVVDNRAQDENSSYVEDASEDSVQNNAKVEKAKASENSEQHDHNEADEKNNKKDEVSNAPSKQEQDENNDTVAKEHTSNQDDEPGLFKKIGDFFGGDDDKSSKDDAKEEKAKTVDDTNNDDEPGLFEKDDKSSEDDAKEEKTKPADDTATAEDDANNDDEPGLFDKMGDFFSDNAKDETSGNDDSEDSTTKPKLDNESEISEKLDDGDERNKAEHTKKPTEQTTSAETANDDFNFWEWLKGIIFSPIGLIILIILIILFVLGFNFF